MLGFFSNLNLDFYVCYIRIFTDINMYFYQGNGYENTYFIYVENTCFTYSRPKIMYYIRMMRIYRFSGLGLGLKFSSFLSQNPSSIPLQSLFNTSSILRFDHHKINPALTLPLQSGFIPGTFKFK